MKAALVIGTALATAAVVAYAQTASRGGRQTLGTDLSTLNVTPSGQSTLMTLANATRPDFINVKKPPFNAFGDNSHDDTVAINAALVAAVASNSFGACVYMPAGAYLISDSINLNGNGSCLYGDGALATRIRWNTTNATKAALVVGPGSFSQRVEHLSVELIGDALAAIWYQGNVGGAIFIDLHINCSHHLGDGILLGGNQADNLTILHPLIENCDQFIENQTAGNPSSGSAIHTTSANSLGIAIYNAFFNRNSVAFNFDSSTNTYCYDCEINAHDLITKHFSINPLLISGGRSEGPKRAYFDAAGGTSAPFTMSNYRIDQINGTRPNVTASIASGTTAVTLSAAGYIFGDQIVLSTAGAAGVALKVRITDMADSTHVTVSGSASTTMTTGAMGFYGYNFAGARCTVATTNTLTTVTFSSPWCMAPGEFITIVGAGLNGRQIVSCLADGVTCTMQNPATATLGAASWFLASSTTQPASPQQSFIFQAGGPYRIEGCSFGGTGSDGQVVFVGSGVATQSLSVLNNFWNADPGPGTLNPFTSAQLPLGMGISVAGNTFTGVAQGWSPGTIPFASLPAALNGTMVYCTDCTIANPCAAAGTGAFAKRMNGIWVCN